MLKQTLSQRMVQKLSPQQIQLMKLLQIPTATLDQRIKEELESNPALEESEDHDEVFDMQDEKVRDEEDYESSTEEEAFELDDYLKEYIEDDPISYKLKGDVYSSEEVKDSPLSEASSFHDHLISQLGMMEFDSEKDKRIAEQIVGSIDEGGYLSIQLSDRIEKSDPSENIRSKELGLKILSKYFDEFSKKHYDRMRRSLSLSEGELKDAIEEILKLNPKPASVYIGSSYGRSSSNQYIVPDFIVTNRDGELELQLNNKNAPDLRISDHYVDVLKGYNEVTQGRKSTKQEKEAVMFIKQKIDSAKWFIDAIKQRQETLYNTMYTIMQYQLDFFHTGDERRIKPMILKDIAEVTGLDISTVSRVANSKFVQTEYGTKRLKDFFSESMTTADGAEVSTLEVKNILSDIIKEENKKKPLSDERLKDMLRQKGYNIARRTVAKYREQLNIPVARLRKEL